MSFNPVQLLHVALRQEDGERPVGRLAWVDRQILFEFDVAFLADPLPLSPAMLPARPGVHTEQKYVFEGLFGLFDDSLPDGWGRLLIDREVDRRGVGRQNLSPLDRLAFVGQDGAGALVYRPEITRDEAPTVLDLRALADESRRVLEGDESSLFPELLMLGESSGGARPKVLLAYHPKDGALAVGQQALAPGFVSALVKFPARSDPPDIGAIELAYARMAGAAGIDMAPTWLLGATKDQPGFFATQRFDRQPRVHVHSAAGLLHASHRVPSMDYQDLLKATRWLTRDQRAVDQLYRRMVFNVLAHNRDDHSRNFSYRMSPDGRWGLTPAYDLTFSSGPGGEHWMTVAGEGRAPGTEHLLRVAAKVGVPDKRAKAVIDEVRAAVAQWARLANEVGVSGASMERIGVVLRQAAGG